MNELVQYLHEVRTELQEIFDDFDNEIRVTDNEQLYVDAHNAVGSKLEDALKDIDSLIMDLDSGMYDKNGFDDFEDD
jgi:predicted neutral ceramidase superfamily lipid hydrolase